VLTAIYSAAALAAMLGLITGAASIAHPLAVRRAGLGMAKIFLRAEHQPWQYQVASHGFPSPQ